MHFFWKLGLAPSWVFYKLMAVVQPKSDLYELKKAIENAKRDTPKIQTINAIANGFKNSTEKIFKTDYGTGTSGEKWVKVLYKTGATKLDKGLILSALSNQIEGNALELGTHLGLGTLYINNNNLNKLITLEGCTETLNVANKHLKDYANIITINTPFESLVNIVSNYAPFSFIYLDGNHTYTHTLQYLNEIKPHLAEKYIIVLDDIRWSSEMFQAWKIACTQFPKHAYIDHFNIGVITNYYPTKGYSYI